MPHRAEAPENEFHSKYGTRLRKRNTYFTVKPAHINILIGLSIALFLTGYFRGDLLQYFISLSLFLLTITLGFLFGLITVFQSLKFKQITYSLIFISAFQLSSIPMGIILNKWDVEQGKNWCMDITEMNLNLDENARTDNLKSISVPKNVSYRPKENNCSVSSILGEWFYNNSSKEWNYSDS